jgi:CHAT domain-containing protein
VVALFDPLRAGAESAAPPLRFSAVEKEAVLAAHPGALVLEGERASYADLAEALRAAPVGWLHLGCHAVQTGPSAELLLADVDAGPAIADLPLTAGARVVLSACATAHGETHRGEGMRALWRAFLYAGASCVVAAARDADDRSTAAWMRGFHRSAAAGAPLADAARDACIAWLDGSLRPEYPRGSAVVDAAHPLLWANYVCIGNDGGPLPSAAGR